MRIKKTTYLSGLFSDINVNPANLHAIKTESQITLIKIKSMFSEFTDKINGSTIKIVIKKRQGSLIAS